MEGVFKHKLWANFTTYFTLLGSTFVSVWLKKDLHFFKNLDKFHQPSTAIRPTYN